MPLSPSPQHVIDRFGHTVDWYRYLGDSSTDGYGSIPEFDPVKRITATINPAETAEFQITTTGRTEERSLVMTTKTEVGVTANDHVRLGTTADPAARDIADPDTGPDGKTGWRCTQPMYGTTYGLARFVLVEDERRPVAIDA